MGLTGFGILAIKSATIFRRLQTWAKGLKRDVVALWIAARDPRVPWHAKAAAGVVAAYALSPIDLIPDFIPIIGYLDDLIIVPIGIALVIQMICTADDRIPAPRRWRDPCAHRAVPAWRPSLSSGSRRRPLSACSCGARSSAYLSVTWRRPGELPVNYGRCGEGSGLAGRDLLRRAMRSEVPSRATPVRVWRMTNSASRPLLVIDGDSFAHRAYHGLPKTIRRAGNKGGGAIVGFANYLLRLYEAEQPRAVLVGWDTLDDAQLAREGFPPYQSGRDFDDEIVDQLDMLPEFVAACGFVFGKAAGFEADDFLATAAAAEEKRGGTALVASGDRDAFQLASDAPPSSIR